jgi:hypothetical protein
VLIVFRSPKLFPDAAFSSDAAVTRIPPALSSGLSMISMGKSLPSFRRPVSSIPVPICCASASFNQSTSLRPSSTKRWTGHFGHEADFDERRWNWPGTSECHKSNTHTVRMGVRLPSDVRRRMYQTCRLHPEGGKFRLWRVPLQRIDLAARAYVSQQ